MRMSRTTEEACRFHWHRQASSGDLLLAPLAIPAPALEWVDEYVVRVVGVTSVCPHTTSLVGRGRVEADHPDDLLAPGPGGYRRREGLHPTVLRSGLPLEGTAVHLE